MKYARHILFFSIFLLQVNCVLSQTEIDSLQESKRKKKWLTGALIAQQTGSLVLEYKWWWKDDFHPFNINNDGGFNNYSLGIDKVGHFYTSYMYANLLYELMKWGNYSEKKQLVYSSILPFAWALSIEIGDGFSSYEFSPADLLANTIGIAYSLAQHKIPYLNHFKVKYSYFPSDFYRNRNYQNWSLTSDYNGHIYWLTADVHQILPKNYRQIWPKYLNLGFGYGVNNFAETGNHLAGFTIQREYFIGLDYNLNAIPIKRKTLSTLRNMVDCIHFPAPGLKNTGNQGWQAKPLLLN